MTVVVHGYREFDKATRMADKDVYKETRQAFRKVAEGVRDDGQSLFSSYGQTASQRTTHAYSARRYRVKTRARGVDVEQTLKRTTGQHPEYGGVQMRRGLVPALDQNRGQLRLRTEKAMDDVVHSFYRRTL